MNSAIIILLIILALVILFICLLKKRKWKFWLDESSLHMQPLFWFLVFIPLIISGIAWVLVSQDYELDVSTNGYSRLMENAKFPFLILALSPILGAFVTSAHRSLQTAKQIEVTENKNKVDIYFSKRKSTYDQLGLMSTKNNEKIINPVGLYLDALITKDYEDSNSSKFIDKINLSISNLNSHILILNQYMKYTNIFHDKLKAEELRGSVIYSIHDLNQLDIELKKIKDLFYLKTGTDKSFLFIYDRYCNTVDSIAEENDQQRLNEEDQIYCTLNIDFMCNLFFVQSVDMIKDFFKFVYIVFSILYLDSHIDILLPALKDSKKTFDEWDMFISEMGF